MGIQAQIPAALCGIHNFIRFHDPAEGRLPDADYLPDDAPAANSEGAPAGNRVPAHDDLHLMRDGIAEAMWVDYQHILRERHGLEDDDNDDLSDQDISEDEGGLG
jgi:hypothetical protein